MIKDITLGQYLPGNSFVHKLDPRTKIIFSFVFLAVIFIINSFYGYLFAALFILLCIAASKIKSKYIFRGLKPLIILIIFTAVINIFLLNGKILVFQWKAIKIYKEGIITAAFMVIRLVLLIMGTSLLTLTTSPIELTDGIESLLSPFKKIGLPAHEFAMMMTIALRFIPTLMDETDKIMKAQMSRGADFESGNILKRAKSLIPILVPLFISSFRRADELAMAMESRCYKGGKGRTRMNQISFKKRDALAFIIIAGILGFSICSRFIWKNVI